MILHGEEEKERDLCADPRRKHETVYDPLMEESSGKDIRLFSLLGILDSYGKNFSEEITNIQKGFGKEKLGYQVLLLINEFIRNAVVIFGWQYTYIEPGWMSDPS